MAVIRRTTSFEHECRLIRRTAAIDRFRGPLRYVWLLFDQVNRLSRGRIVFTNAFGHLIFVRLPLNVLIVFEFVFTEVRSEQRGQRVECFLGVFANGLQQHLIAIECSQTDKVQCRAFTVGSAIAF
jgi:hypothetical protein